MEELSNERIKLSNSNVIKSFDIDNIDILDNIAFKSFIRIET